MRGEETMQAASERIKGGPGGALISRQEEKKNKTKLEDHKQPNHLKRLRPCGPRGAKRSWTLRERGRVESLNGA